MLSAVQENLNSERKIRYSNKNLTNESILISDYTIITIYGHNARNKIIVENLSIGFLKFRNTFVF